MDGRGGLRITPRLVFGLVIVLLGVLFMLDNLKIVEAERLLRYWPVVLIAVGVVKLFAGGPVAARAASAFWLIAGALLLLVNLGYFNLQIFWPLLLLLLGGWIVLRSLTGTVPPSGGVDSSSTCPRSR